jgi:hypothetical protein
MSAMGNTKYVRSGVFTKVIMKTTAFWDVTPCRLVYVYLLFGFRLKLRCIRQPGTKDCENLKS